jgi:hypothetical protein
LILPRSPRLRTLFAMAGRSTQLTWLDKLTSALRRTSASLRHRERNTGRVQRRTSPTARKVEHGVTVEYTPQLDGDPDPGEVVWTWVPFEDDPTLGKDRPVLVIGRHGAVLSGVALTSKRKDRDDYVDVGTGEWDSKHRPSYAKVEHLLDIDPDVVRREGAILNRRQFDDVVEAVVRLHGVTRR